MQHRYSILFVAFAVVGLFAAGCASHSYPTAQIISDMEGPEPVTPSTAEEAAAIPGEAEEVVPTEEPAVVDVPEAPAPTPEAPAVAIQPVTSSVNTVVQQPDSGEETYTMAPWAHTEREALPQQTEYKAAPYASAQAKPYEKPQPYKVIEVHL